MSTGTIREPLSTVTATQERIECFAQHLFNDQRAPAFRKTIRIEYNMEQVADRFLLVPPVNWSEATEALKELTPSQRQKLVSILESRAQNSARQASYLYTRITGQGDQGHKAAIRQQNTVGRKLNKAFGYDGRYSVNINV